MSIPTTNKTTSPDPKNIAPTLASIQGKELGLNGHTEEVGYGPRRFDDIHQKEVVNSFGNSEPIDHDTRHYLNQTSGVIGAMTSTTADSSSAASSKVSTSEKSVQHTAAVGRQPITQSLIALLEESELGHFGDNAPNLKQWLSESIKQSYDIGVSRYPPSGILNVQTLEDYYDFVDQRVQDLPHETHSGAFLQAVCEWHWPLSQDIAGFPEGSIQANDRFGMWMTDWANAWGTYLNGSGSLKYLTTFIDDPSFRMEDYIVPSGGFQSFNEFFAREVKDGKRPVSSPADASVVVSPADSVPQGHWDITSSSTITNAKGMTYSIQEILGDLSDDFAGGVFTHTFLNVYDYHRYRVPVGGTIVGIRQFVKHAAMTVEPGTQLYPQNTLKPIDSTGFQFSQTRSMVIIDTAGTEYANAGLVIAMPMGMAMVSSCNITLKLGQKVEKGDELGYFLFGGSDYVMIFQAQANFQLTATPDQHIFACTPYGTVTSAAATDYTPPAEATAGWSGKRGS